MNKVLYYSPSVDDSTSFYRSHGVLPYLSSPDYELIDISSVKHFTWATFAGAQALILQRPTEDLFLNVIRMAKQMKLKVILDYDDDVLNVDMYNPVYQYHKKQHKTTSELLNLANEIWVTTEGLYQSLGHQSKTYIIPNALNDYIFTKPRTYNEESKIVVWRGSQTHEADVYEIADELVEFINRNKDWKFYFIGHRFTFLEQRCSDNYFAVTPMYITDYFQFLYELNPNIMIVPLADTKINRSKSNISVIEALFTGAVPLVNKELTEFNLPNLGSLKHWMKEDLNQLISGDMKQMNRAAWYYVASELRLSLINHLRNARLEAI